MRGHAGGRGAATGSGTASSTSGTGPGGYRTVADSGWYGRVRCPHRASGDHGALADVVVEVEIEDERPVEGVGHGCSRGSSVAGCGGSSEGKPGTPPRDRRRLGEDGALPPRLRKARMSRTARRALVLVVAVGLLSACTGEDPTPRRRRPPARRPTRGRRAEDVVLTRTIPGGGADVEVAVHPVVRVGDQAVLTLDLSSEAATEAEELYTGYLFAFGGFPTRLDPSALRLFDLERDEVYEVALDAENYPVAALRATCTASRPAGSGSRSRTRRPRPTSTVSVCTCRVPPTWSRSP